LELGANVKSTIIGDSDQLSAKSKLFYQKRFGIKQQHFIRNRHFFSICSTPEISGSDALHTLGE
jgi:hypothetical protein